MYVWLKPRNHPDMVLVGVRYQNGIDCDSVSTVEKGMVWVNVFQVILTIEPFDSGDLTETHQLVNHVQLSWVQKTVEILLLNLEALSEVEEYLCVLVLQQDFVSTNLANAAIECKIYHHAVPIFLM